MRKGLRWAGFALVGVLGLLVVAFIGVRLYLNTDSAKQLAAGQLRTFLGDQVRVTELSTGAASTTVGLELPGAGGDQLFAGRVSVDVSPIGLATGRQPNVVSANGPRLTLHLDENNNILDPLPDFQSQGGGGAIPEIRITDAVLRFVQTGKPEFVANGVNATITSPNSTSLKLDGTIADPTLGDWTLTGEWSTDGKAGVINLAAARPVAVTPELLKSIPFVPLETWDAVTLAGDTTAAVQVSRSAAGEWGWRVECAPQRATATVAAIGGLVVSNLAGSLVVDGNKVTLTGMTGDSADGTVAVDGQLDFSSEPSKMSFVAEARELDIKKLPPEWGLSARLDSGRLNGRGTVALDVGAGQVKPTSATGKAVLTGNLFGGDATIEVFPAVKGGALEFTDEPTATRPRRTNLAFASAFATRLVVLMPVLVQPPPAPAEPEAAPEPPKYLRANLNLRDVDIAELLKRGNVSVGTPIAGRVTLALAAEIPTNTPGTLKTYRATGTVASPQLQVGELTLNDLTANVEFRDGVLTLTTLAAKFPPTPDAPDSPPGLEGHARFGVDPRTDLTADLKLDRVPLRQVFGAVPEFAGNASGPLSGDLVLTIPGDKLSDVAAYSARGTLTSPELTLYGQIARQLAVTLNLDQGVAQISKASVDIYGGSVSGSAKLLLTGNQSGPIDIKFQNIDADALTKAIPDSPVTLAGTVSGTLVGTLPPLPTFEASKITGDLNLAAPTLIVQGIPASKLSGKLGYKPGAITYDLKGDALGGEFDLNGAYPLGSAPAPAADPNAALPGRGEIHLRDLRLDRLAPDLRRPGLQPLRGRLSLDLDTTIDSAGAFEAVGVMVLNDLGWGTRAASQLRADIRITQDGVEIRTVTGNLARGTVRGRASYSFQPNGPREAVLKLNHLDASQVLEPFGVSGATGDLSAYLTTTLGGELRGGGLIQARHVHIGGTDIADFRVPLTWTLVPGARPRGTLTTTGASGTVANGHVRAKARVTYQDAAAVELKAEFIDVDVGQLSLTAAAARLGIGRATGRLDINGRSVRRVADLNGTLTAKFGETSARNFPILGDAINLIPTAGELARFDTGDLVARLGNGQVRVEQLNLIARSARLHADGTVNLNGRLDLDVVYATGQVGPNAPLLRTIARNIPAIGPVPVGLIVRVSEALSNRVVRVRVGGTTARPVYSIDPARLLTENAVRFFLGQYTADYLPDLPTPR